MALQPFSTLATYVPEGDQDTELMAELQKQNKTKQNKRIKVEITRFSLIRDHITGTQ